MSWDSEFPLPVMDWEVVDAGNPHCCGGLHAAAVTISHRLRDCFLAKFWVRCWECDLKMGPYDTQLDALSAVRRLERIACRR